VELLQSKSHKSKPAVLLLDAKDDHHESHAWSRKGKLAVQQRKKWEQWRERECRWGDWKQKSGGARQNVF
jgi:hypothetical protein